MLLGKLQAGLYNVAANHVQVNSFVPQSCFGAISDAKLWHLCLGHVPFDHLSHVFPSVLKGYCKEIICTVCPAVRKKETLPYQFYQN